MIPGTISRHTTNDTAGISKPRGHVFCFVLPEENTKKREKKRSPRFLKRSKRKTDLSVVNSVRIDKTTGGRFNFFFLGFSNSPIPMWLLNPLPSPETILTPSVSSPSLEYGSKRAKQKCAGCKVVSFSAPPVLKDFGREPAYGCGCSVTGFTPVPSVAIKFSVPSREPGRQQRTTTSIYHTKNPGLLEYMVVSLCLEN